MITSGEIELTSNRLSQYFNGTASTTYVNSNQLINISKLSSHHSERDKSKYYHEAANGTERYLI